MYQTVPPSLGLFERRTRASPHPSRQTRQGRTRGDEREHGMTEQVLDVKGAFRLIRSFWRTVAAFVLAGLAATVLFTFGTRAGYQATSLVLLPAPSSSSSTSGAPRGVTTDARIATSAAVLLPAGRIADPSLSLRTLQERVSTASAATSVLKITATGSTAKEAELLAN